MKNYYEVLDVAKDATVIDIKRAYFTKVKVNRPEDDPEAFKLVRLAYETLTDVSARKKYDERLDVPAEIAEDFFQSVSLLEDNRYKEAIAQLKQLIQKYPEAPEFEQALGEAYLKTKSNGTAIKHLEQAAKKYPKDLNIQTLLATAYDRRGWNNKARVQYEHAVSLDQSNPKAWCAYLHHCDRKSAFMFNRVFLKAMAVNKEMFVDNDYNLYMAEMVSVIEDNFYDFDDGLENLPSEVEVYFKLYFKGMEQTKASIESKMEYQLLLMLAALFSDDEETIELTKLALPYLERNVHGKDINNAKAIKMMRKNIIANQFYADDDISDVLRDLIAHASCKCGYPNCSHKGRGLLIKGYLLGGITQYEKEILYLKEKYPDIYQIEEKFFNNALTPTRISSMIAKNKQQTALFMKRNPRFLKETAEEVGETWQPSVEPMVRQQPKVGRNDPCPCGSGKKHKKCCG